MRIEDAPDLEEAAQLEWVEGLVHARQKELLMPAGLRKDEHANWQQQLYVLVAKAMGVQEKVTTAAMDAVDGVATSPKVKRGKR